MTAISETAIFATLGDGRFAPTELARGPWDVGACHGGPPTALAARAAEGVLGGGAWHVARLTVELLRPVPLAPLTPAAELVQAGRQVQRVGASLSLDDGTVVLRLVALALRVRPLDLSAFDRAAAARPGDTAPPAGPFEARPGASPPGVHHHGFHDRGMEIRWARGAYAEQGAAFAWMRLAAPLVAGETPSPLQRTAAAADFGNGVASALPWTSHTFVNPDLTVYLHRPPIGEWVGVDAVTRPEPSGVGLAESALFDETGPIGRAAQSLLLAPR
ncbi:MAG: thioesterase family protein [Acidimicrobiales bacterium]